MKYTIEWAEVSQTSTGKTKATLTLVGADGVTVDKVTAWGDFPNFTELQPGKSVEGDVVVKVNGKFTNKTLYPKKTDTLSNPSAPAWAKKPSGIAAAMKTKEASIAKFQDNKSEMIEKMASFRDATLLTVEWSRSMGLPVSEDELKTKWKSFRKWLQGEMEGEPF